MNTPAQRAPAAYLDSPDSDLIQPMFNTYNKLQYFLDLYERTQAKIEALEADAMAKARPQVAGRMERTTSGPLPETLIASGLLETHAYQRLVAIRRGYQERVQVYAAALTAGVENTSNAIDRVSGRVMIPKT